MAKGKSLVIAGIAAGAYAYFRKKENRDKAVVAFNNTKVKVNSFIEAQKHNYSELTEAGHPNPYDEGDSRMVDEGALTSVQYYNAEVQDDGQDDSFGDPEQPADDKKK
ncbi:hypothetical protein [Viridibacillus sp. FSL H8-0110]|uniref:hypothetical protein n=1 Tax=Viridibacillus sp. FSL H8-0110 TaxID=2921376 RepID=UPI0030F59035